MQTIDLGERKALRVTAWVGSQSFDVPVPNPALLERLLAKPHIRDSFTRTMERWLHAAGQPFMILSVGSAEVSADRLGAEFPAGPLKTSEYWAFVDDIRSFAL